MTRQLTNLAKRTLPFELRLALRRANWQARYALQRAALADDKPRVYCPVARESFDCFIRQGTDLLTPANGARARHRLIWRYLERETDLLTRPHRLLHVAPEVCLLPRFRENPSIEYVPGDKFVDGYGEQAGVQYIDLLNLAFPDAHFDFTLCNHVLEHIRPDVAAMGEMYRTLRPGGTLLVTVPIKETLAETYENDEVTSPRERAEHFGQWDHVRYYGLDIADRLRSVGFDVSLERYGERFSEEEFRRYGLNRDLLVVCRKPDGA